MVKKRMMKAWRGDFRIFLATGRFTPFEMAVATSADIRREKSAALKHPITFLSDGKIVLSHYNMSPFGKGFPVDFFKPRKSENFLSARLTDALAKWFRIDYLSGSGYRDC